jgi:hypothetical protein
MAMVAGGLMLAIAGGVVALGHDALLGSAISIGGQVFLVSEFAILWSEISLFGVGAVLVAIAFTTAGIALTLDHIFLGGGALIALGLAIFGFLVAALRRCGAIERLRRWLVGLTEEPPRES